MEDNYIVMVALFLWKVLGDLWELYALFPTWVASDMGEREEPRRMLLIPYWGVWVWVTVWAIWGLINRPLEISEAQSAQRIEEMKKAFSIVIARSANNKNSESSIPSKGSARRDLYEIEDLLKKLLDEFKNQKSRRDW